MLNQLFSIRIKYKLSIFLRILIVLAAYYSTVIGFMMDIFLNIVKAKYYEDPRSNFNLYLQKLDQNVSSTENIYKKESLTNFALYRIRLIIRHMLGKVNSLYREGNPKYFNLTDPISYYTMMELFTQYPLNIAQDSKDLVWSLNRLNVSKSYEEFNDYSEEDINAFWMKIFIFLVLIVLILLSCYFVLFDQDVLLNP